MVRRIGLQTVTVVQGRHHLHPGTRVFVRSTSGGEGRASRLQHRDDVNVVATGWGVRWEPLSG
jgi:hypothetical protein